MRRQNTENQSAKTALLDIVGLLVQNDKTQYSRSSEFFMIANNYLHFDQDITKLKLDKRKISTIKFQCSGHGAFRKQIVAERFLNHLYETLSCKQMPIKNVQLKISGFNMNLSKEIYKIRMENKQKLYFEEDKEFSFILKLRKILGLRVADLNSLEIRVNSVHYCTAEDLKDVLEIGLFESIRLDNVTKENSLVNLSYELSDWNFFTIRPKTTQQLKAEKKKQDQNQSLQSINPTTKQTIDQCQLKYNQLRDSLFNVINLSNSRDQQKFIQIKSLKRFRLQLSTFIYSEKQSNSFIESIKEHSAEYAGRGLKLKNKPVKDEVHYFHYKMREFVRNLVIEAIPNLTTLQIDLRNWFKKLEMNALKDELVNISRINQPKVQNDAQRSNISQNSIHVSSKQQEASKNNLDQELNLLGRLLQGSYLGDRKKTVVQKEVNNKLNIIVVV